MTWTAGFTERFAGQPLGASKSLCGVKPGNLEMMRELINNGTMKQINETMLSEGDIPESFDSETNWPECSEVIGDIRDQSNCGCCWAFGSASAASDRLCIATGGKVKVPLSAQEMCFCGSRNGCGGGWPFSAWDVIGKRGLVTGGQYNGTGPFGPDAGFCSAFSLPHCHHHGPKGDDPYPTEGQKGCPIATSPKCPTTCDENAKAPYNDFSKYRYTYSGHAASYTSEAAIQAAIMTEGPVTAAFTVYQDFESYVSGIYQHVSGTQLGGHAVRIVGWGVDGIHKYWKVANSWNPYWGEKGYFRIHRGDNECGIESAVVANVAGDKWTGPGL
eukprot:CAMPEP_0170195038 /NCGR_PEP_ID=MMETSP0040_2-20121228/60605_1 /TAXON_ID=641309 /ORGANISM="Lotharella oceanica, Strain CCMP622" /LENGTH=329 /DNA_ID=CAMNT_0010444103 /DNA_START=40 /DNA_END=1029 /DNA_ORIENTATION=-